MGIEKCQSQELKNLAESMICSELLDNVTLREFIIKKCYIFKKYTI